MSSYTSWVPRKKPRWQIRNTTSLWNPKGKRKFPRHILIPDTQLRAGVPGEHLHAAGVYCALKQPDVIIFLGDVGDYPSCSSWDKDKKDFGQQSYQADNDAVEHGIQVFLTPIIAAGEKTGWTPRIICTMGNHPDRVDRILGEAINAKWAEAVEWPCEVLDRYGIETFPFLEPVLVDGIAYCHFFANPMTGRPLGGMVQTRLKNVGFSFSQGHQQILDMGNRTLGNGQVQRGLVAGAFYQHDEDYRSGPANLHWRGILVKNEVDGYGDYSLMDINMEYLLREHAPDQPITISTPNPDWVGCGPWTP